MVIYVFGCGFIKIPKDDASYFRRKRRKVVSVLAKHSWAKDAIETDIVQ